MKVIIVFSIFLISSLSFAALISPKKSHSNKQSKMTEILTNIFYEELYKRTKDLKPENVVIKVMPPSKSSLNDGKRGKKIIEMMLQKNREKLARMRGYDPEKVKDGKDIVKLQKEDNKVVLDKMREEEKRLAEKYAHLTPEEKRNQIWQDHAKNELDEIKNKVLKDHREWRKKHAKTLQEWAKKQKDYVENIDEYKKTLFKIPAVLPVTKEEAQKKVEVKIDKEFFIVSNALVPEIKDQKHRPTCSSFAGVRAIETLLSQHGRDYDLSEQYFYWASKPDCRDSKCTRKGSWVGHGLMYTRDKGGLNIPLETDCPYNDYPVASNETQIPLASQCLNGVVSVKKFRYLKTLDAVMKNLKRNIPVMASLTLTPNFYKNNGLVLESEKNTGGKMDSHASGHAALIVGYLKLPRALNEGAVCFITANSWGKGWGNGGYACLSEKWLLKHRNRNPFVIVNQLTI